MESSAMARGTGIAKRSPEYIEKKIDEGKAVIAVTHDGKWVGFCYIETWSHGEYVANSGLDRGSRIPQKRCSKIDQEKNLCSFQGKIS